MYAKTLNYTDYNGVERTETFYFNFSKAEVTEMELTKDGGLSTYLKKIVDSKDQASIIKMFKELILKSYGVKSDDGRRFIKSEKLSEEFEQTAAYSELFTLFGTNTNEAIMFINNVIPNVPNKNNNLEREVIEESLNGITSIK